MFVRAGIFFTETVPTKRTLKWKKHKHLSNLSFYKNGTVIHEVSRTYWVKKLHVEKAVLLVFNAERKSVPLVNQMLNKFLKEGFLTSQRSR